MGLPRPKILTRFTVPTGGYQLRFDISDAGLFDTTLTATVPALDYYMAWDQQADDFVKALAKAMNDAISASGGGFAGQRAVAVWIDDSANHVVNIQFAGAEFTGATKQDVRIQWTALDGATIAGILGVDGSSDESKTGSDNPLFTGVRQHAYGWYSDEDGNLRSLTVVLNDEPIALQSISPAQKMKTVHIGASHTAMMRLQHLPRAKTYSDQRDYAATPLHPLKWNEGLESWWRLASKGTPFRVYRDGSAVGLFGRARDRGVATGTAAAQVQDANKAWQVDPDENLKRHVIVDAWPGNVNGPMRWEINSTASSGVALLLPSGAEPSDDNPAGIGDTYYIFDQRYDTFKVDLSATQRFAPQELPNIDRYDFSVSLRTFVE